MHPAPAAPHKPKKPIRIVTAAALFDGQDAAINSMRRIIQSSGAEVVHLVYRLVWHQPGCSLTK